MIDKVREYFESELQSAKIACMCKRYSKKEVISNAVMRCLGVVFFVQTNENSYPDIDDLYEEYKEKLKNL